MPGEQQALVVAGEPKCDMHVLVRAVDKTRAKTPAMIVTRSESADLYSDRPPFAAQL